jgi:C-terminal processing protease CtpA/Prc
MSISNKGDKIAYVINYGKLIIANIDKNGKLSNSITLLDSWAEPSSVKWSPDDQFIAYSKTNLDFNQEIYIQAADNSVGPVNVSMHPRADVSPSWSPDGKKLLFSSIRNYGNYDIWYVWLQKKDWEKTMTEWKQEEGESDGDAAKDKKDKKGKKDKTIEVKIDFDHIYQRLYQLTSLPGNESQAIFSKDGKTIYFKSNSNAKGKTDLYKIDWDKKNIKELTKDGKAGNGMILSPDGKYIYMVNKGGKPARLKTATDKIENIAINASADINHQALKEQVYHEAWKTINDGFYDPNYHQRDWAKLGEMYKPIILNTSTDRDFQDLFNWLLGELNASHMGLRNPKPKNKSKDKTALLGIGFTAEKDGLHITKILPESPADKEESKLLTGDIITQFNENKINKQSNLYELLLNKANEPCLLQVNRNGSNKEIIIRPTASLYNQNYADWVEFNRSLVDKYSDEKLGYLHIKAMGWTSFEKFERDLMAAGYAKEGILIDVRYNGGGWTTDYLMAVLNVKQHAYTIPRGASNDLEKDHLNFREHYAFGERLPFASWTKPSIALCNQNSYSNAEIFSHAYKSNHLGTLVGTPTFGAVISTGSRRLSNGGTIRLPFRAWYVKESDMNMELHGAVPDVIVDIKPDSRTKGKDEQLEKAVELLLKQISEDVNKE